MHVYACTLETKHFYIGQLVEEEDLLILYKFIHGYIINNTTNI